MVAKRTGSLRSPAIEEDDMDDEPEVCWGFPVISMGETSIFMVHEWFIFMADMNGWLVVWNIFYFPIYWE